MKASIALFIILFSSSLLIAAPPEIKPSRGLEGLPYRFISPEIKVDRRDGCLIVRLNIEAKPGKAYQVYASRYGKVWHAVTTSKWPNHANSWWRVDKHCNLFPERQLLIYAIEIDLPE